MNIQSLRKLLNNVKNGKVEVDNALEKLKTLPFEDLGFAKVDHHRNLRNGYPEVIYCEGKTLEQIKAITEKLIEKQNNIMATRASADVFNIIKEVDNNCIYYKEARIVIVNKKKINLSKKKIAVISAGTADIPVAEEAAVTAETMGNSVDRIYDVGVSGIHRLFANIERINSANIIIVVAGMEGALASVIGGIADKPIVAVPTSIGYGASFNGLSALLTMLNSCANGISVVNIDNGFGAGYFASMVNKL